MLLFYGTHAFLFIFFFGNRNENSFLPQVVKKIKEPENKNEEYNTFFYCLFLYELKIDDLQQVVHSLGSIFLGAFSRFSRFSRFWKKAFRFLIIKT
jgi:hypothetical protein